MRRRTNRAIVAARLGLRHGRAQVGPLRASPSQWRRRCQGLGGQAGTSAGGGRPSTASQSTSRPAR
ncbi:hypothetical protein [Nonomuraea rubra]|uniref:hypothetical protein n=1 Tax=Nonomuraea rubra TaxID=46180 RepID=UPI0031EC9F9D